jgi:hypothetical protein
VRLGETWEHFKVTFRQGLEARHGILQRGHLGGGCIIHWRRSLALFQVFVLHIVVFL